MLGAVAGGRLLKTRHAQNPEKHSHKPDTRLHCPRFEHSTFSMRESTGASDWPLTPKNSAPVKSGVTLHDGSLTRISKKRNFESTAKLVSGKRSSTPGAPGTDAVSVVGIKPRYVNPRSVGVKYVPVDADQTPEAVVPEYSFVSVAMFTCPYTTFVQ